MAVFRAINIDYWQDGFILELTPEEKYFYIYLMTNGKSNQCGIFELAMRIMEIETGFNRETITKYIQRFVEYKKIVFDEDTKEIFIVNWIKYNNNKGIKVIKCIEKELKAIKSQKLKTLFLESCKKYKYNINPNEIFKEDEDSYKIFNNQSTKDEIIDRAILKDLDKYERTLNSKKENNYGNNKPEYSKSKPARAHEEENESIYERPSEEQLKRAREL